MDFDKLYDNISEKIIETYLTVKFTNSTFGDIIIFDKSFNEKIPSDKPFFLGDIALIKKSYKDVNHEIMNFISSFKKGAKYGIYKADTEQTIKVIEGMIETFNGTVYKKNDVFTIKPFQKTFIKALEDSKIVIFLTYKS